MATVNTEATTVMAAAVGSWDSSRIVVVITVAPFPDAAFTVQATF